MNEISLWKFSEIFSLTGAAFNYSAYQHPRRDLGINTNGYPMAYNIPIGRVFMFTLCNCLLFNLFIVVFSRAKVTHFENNDP